MQGITSHAAARMQQRGIPEPVVELLLACGDSMHDHRGAEIFFFGKSARRRLQRQRVDAVFRGFERYLRTYAVLGRDGSVLTVGHRRKHLRR